MSDYDKQVPGECYEDWNVCSVPSFKSEDNVLGEVSSPYRQSVVSGTSNESEWSVDATETRQNKTIPNELLGQEDEPSPASYADRVIQEILETEEAYLNDLHDIIKVGFMQLLIPKC